MLAIAKSEMLLKRPKILVVVAVPMTVKAFLMNYLRALAHDHDVTVVCSGHDPNLAAALPSGVSMVSIDVRRTIDPFGDFKSLIALLRFIHAGRFDMVHSVTPKAGLLAQLAGYLSGVGIRVHTFTGQVWVTRRGPFRWLLKTLDKVIARCATHLLADSASQRDFLIAEGVVPEGKMVVLGAGSISGVDTQRFRPDAAIRHKLRSQLGYQDNDVLALFVGRLNKDKGVLDLVAAFCSVTERLPQLALLLVGPDEENLGPEILRLSGGASRLQLQEATSRPEDFMAAADFFCLPSYREGFGSVVIEAAACGIPAMVSEIYGLTDAVEVGVTGAWHPPHDIKAIADLLERFALDRDWRKCQGKQARKRVLEQFSAEALVSHQMAFVRARLDHLKTEGHL